jgi:hypothetical protein
VDDSKEPPLKAAASDQQRLLDVQALDTRLDQLAHRRRTLPEHAALAELETELGVLRDQQVEAETEQSDLARELKKAEGDVDQVRARAERDQQRLDAGQVSSPKELESLQHEIATLGNRQGDLEEVVLEIMERLESSQSRSSELAAQQEAARARVAAGPPVSLDDEPGHSPDSAVRTRIRRHSSQRMTSSGSASRSSLISTLLSSRRQPPHRRWRSSAAPTPPCCSRIFS